MILSINNVLTTKTTRNLWFLPTKKPTSPTTYTETTTQVPMPTVERQTQQQIIYNAPKQCGFKW